MRIYVASSWRNDLQPGVVATLRAAGHMVYDFKNPPNRSGFAWAQIDPEWETWTPEAYVEHLEHPDADAGFAEDMHHLNDADATVLVLPCNRSAHLELGYAVGIDQRTAILLADHQFEPELMYKMVDIVTPDVSDIVRWLS